MSQLMKWFLVSWGTKQSFYLLQKIASVLFESKWQHTAKWETLFEGTETLVKIYLGRRIFFCLVTTWSPNSVCYQVTGTSTLAVSPQRLLCIFLALWMKSTKCKLKILTNFIHISCICWATVAYFSVWWVPSGCWFHFYVAALRVFGCQHGRILYCGVRVFRAV